MGEKKIKLLWERIAVPVSSYLYISENLFSLKTKNVRSLRDAISNPKQLYAAKIQ